MIKIENQKIELSIIKNGKEVKRYNFKNTLTDICLDVVLRRAFPLSLWSTIFDIEQTFVNNLFYNAHFIFNNIKPTITNATTDINDITTNSAIVNLAGDISYTNKGRIVTTTYRSSKDPELSNYATWNPDNPGEKLQYICFTHNALHTADELLMSYIDVSDLDIYESDSLAFSTSRYDYIESNEIQITANDLKPHLPRVDNMLSSWYLDTITTCYGANGVGDMKSYNVNDLDFERLSAGVVEVSGFDNYKIESNVLLCSEETICGEDTIITQPAEKIMSVRFRYSRIVTGTYYYSDTYVNIQDLDVTYSDKEFKIKLKCERGAY